MDARKAILSRFLSQEPAPISEDTMINSNETITVSDELISELSSRFSNYFEEFHTFLKPHPASTDVSNLETATIRLEITKAAVNSQDVCSIFNLSREEFFFGSFILTLRQYLGYAPLSLGVQLPIHPSNVQDNFELGQFTNVLPITTGGIDMAGNLNGFWQLVKNETAFFLQFKRVNFSKFFAADDLRPYTHMVSYEQLTKEGESVIPPKNPKVPFSLAVTEDGNLNGTWVTLTWAKVLLDEEVANFFVLNFISCCQLLGQVATQMNDPGTILLESMDLMCPQERRLMDSFNREVPAHSTQTSVITTFDRNAALNPEKFAVYEKESEYTYTQLSEASRKIASALLVKFGQEKLVKSPVILVMEKNFQCIASVLAVWRAGGYFIPIDTNMQERMIGLDNGTDITCLLTNLLREDLHPVATKNRWEILRVQELMDLKEESQSMTQPVINPESPAYMTMTSGSTGKPKKCINSHAGLIQFIHAAVSEYQLNENTNVLQWVPFSFDVFFSDLVKSLICTNGSLTMVTSGERLQVDKIASLVANRGVNYIHMTPTFALFACQTFPSIMNGVHDLCLGGEALTWKTLELLKTYLEDGTNIYNCYGLTEATIESTNFLIPADETYIQDLKQRQRGTGIVPIGRPLPGIRVTVLDPTTMLEVPIGSSGMVAISGPTVGSGDVPIVFHGTERWLLTGDTGSWLPDGNLEFKARRDTSSLKIGGLRINCEELESLILTTFPNLEAAVVLAAEIQDTVFLAVALQTSDKSFNGQSLQDALRKLVPYYMVPQIVDIVNKFPLSTNGKLDRKALKSNIEAKNRQPQRQVSQNVFEFQNNENEMELQSMEKYLVEHLSKISGRSATSISRLTNLRDQGFTSLQLIQFGNTLVQEDVEGYDGISDLFTYPTISHLAQKLVGTNTMVPNEVKMGVVIKDAEEDKICIVGIAFRLPGNLAGSIPDLWTTLSAGTCNVKAFPENRSEDVLTRMSEPFTAGAIPASFFDSIDGFDHEFFNIAPNEANHICPEQRLFLEVGTEALIDAGYNLAAIDGTNIGVYATATEVEYGIIDKSLEGVAVVGRQSSVVPSRLSYTFNLKGGNYVVDTACSAAIVAVEQAVRDLRAGQCSAALVGGTNIYLYPAKDGLMGTNLIHSPSANCLPFDDRADGTVSGEGVFAYVLKTRREAEANSDHIYATFESICSNSVGRANGVTAPSVDSQVAVIHSALHQAGITIDDVDLVETHGTGTILGDQIELCALSTVFSSRKKPLPLGGAKHNFGHLDMAAGYLSILKATAALTFNSSPPLAHIQRPSKYLDKSVFKTSAPTLRNSEKRGGKLFAGISAYGLSGTNCHAVISVGIQLQRSETSTLDTELTPCHFLVPIDEGRLTLEEMCGIYSRYIKFYPGLSIQDICGTQTTNLLNLGGKGQKVGVFSVSSTEELIRQLDAIASGITVVSQANIKEMDLNGLSEALPKQPWTRAPALPKCFFKKFRHWLPPIETKKNGITESNPLAILASFLGTKTKEAHALAEMSHKLESVIADFSLKLMQDLMINENFQPMEIIPKDDTSRVPDLSQNVLEPKSEPTSLTLDKLTLTFESTYEIISKIWEECLGNKEIGEGDVFRDLGGDSLVTVQMMKIVGSRFGLKLRAADAFANPTLASLSSFVFNQCSEFSPGTKNRFSGMPMKMIMFPGQGSQKVGMCESLLNSEAAMEVIREAEDITGMNILSRLSDPEAFQNTAFVQVALFVGSLAKIAQLKVDEPEVLQGIRAVAGLSAGEFAALVFAGAIEFKDALEIVQFRGKVMQEAVMATRTGMVSIFGPQREHLQDWLSANFPDMLISTILGDNQFTVGGPLDSCELLTAELNSTEDLEVIDARVLRVAGAFHTEWMKSAAVETGKLIDGLRIQYPKIGIIMNADGAVAMNKDDIRFNLKKQTANPVMWRDSMLTAHQIGIRNFVEISPSSVLTPILQKRIAGITNSKVTLIRI